MCFGKPNNGRCRCTFDSSRNFKARVYPRPKRTAGCRHLIRIDTYNVNVLHRSNRPYNGFWVRRVRFFFSSKRVRHRLYIYIFYTLRDEYETRYRDTNFPAHGIMGRHRRRLARTKT